MTGPDAQTLAVYDAGATAYGDRFGADGAWPRLDRFLDGLRPGARLLDLGCGAGHAAARMRAAGFETVALDASPGMAAEALRRHGLSVVVADFAAIAGLGRFDGIWAHFSLLHAPRADLPGHLVRIRAALVPGGRLAVTMKTGTGEARDRLGRFYSYVTADELAGLLATAGLAVDQIDEGEVVGFDDTRAGYVAVTAHA